MTGTGPHAVRLVATVVTGASAIGCSTGEPNAFDQVPRADAEAQDAGPADTGSDVALDASEAAVALAWSLSPIVPNGDVVSIWGSDDSNVFVGTDSNAVYWLRSGGILTTNLPAKIAGGGWAADQTHVYAAGTSAWLEQEGLTSAGGLYRNAYNAWTPILAGSFYSVWGSSADDVYAVGSAGIVHSVLGGPFVSESSASALSVWGSGPGDLYASTSDPTATLLHSAGDGGWQPVHAQASGRAWAVWTAAPGDVYLVVSPASAGDPDAFVEHATADGGWASESVPQPGSRLVALWGSGPGDVYAGGWHADTAGRQGDLFHSSGDGQWSRVDLPGNLYEVTSVWGSSAADVYVGGYDFDEGPVVLEGKPP